MASSLGLNLSSYNLLGSFFLLLLPQPSLVLPVSWSLSYELYFYGLFFLLLWVPIRVVCRFIPVMFVMLLAVVLIFKTDVLSPLDFILSGFLLEFFAGLMIGLISNYLIDIRFRGGFVLLAIVMIALGISNEVVSLPSRALTYGAAGVFLVIHAIAAPNRIRSRLSGVANLLGNASYTIYLSHLPLISVFYLLGFRDWFAIRGAGCAELGLVAMVLVCLIFSVLFYSWIERPLYRAAINAIKKPG